MTDNAELKRLAIAAPAGPWYQHGGIKQVVDRDCEAVCETFEEDGDCPTARFIAAANPAVVLALLDDLDEARNGMKYACGLRLKKEIDRLRDENEELRAQIGRAQIVELANFDWDAELTALRKNAERYEVLRQADLDTIHNGGLFAGLTPENVVVNGGELDVLVDAVIASRKEPQP
ncbi:ead/Ea22-like family protein [Pseudomonas sp. T1.Ur]|uniref:ead/Ea22-like family protein n=1 Tax=Pseudomonas sp. T1.Ur TaxID=2928704 RepID=UPI00201E4119|nr:ead/Ea22-like family protein [Pseudomonas sp. T1.Ur]MCL6701119.1 ead/Ea22-like family protein [Pseudomonas sp. T1.Ur]